MAALRWEDLTGHQSTVDKAVELVPTAPPGRPELRLAPTNRATRRWIRLDRQTVAEIEGRRAEREGLRRSCSRRACDRYEQIAARVQQLQREQHAYGRFGTDQGWRRAEVTHLTHQLDCHWAQVVACVRADDPLAYGIDKLRHARITVERD